MHKGQALLVVLLVVGVALTVSLAIVSRSVTEVGVSTSQEESTRALEAAEAGVEKSLAGVSGFAGEGHAVVTLPNNAQVNVVNTYIYTLPNLDAGDVATVDLAGISPAQLRVCWGDNTVNPAAEVMIYTQAGGGVNIHRWMLGPGFGTDGVHNSENCPGGGKAYSHWKAWQPGDWGGGTGETLTMMRIRMIGATDQPVAVSLAGSASLPPQGRDIVSSGMAGTSTQKIRVVQSNPDVPFMFDSALFSGRGDLTK